MIAPGDAGCKADPLRSDLVHAFRPAPSAKSRTWLGADLVRQA